MSEVEVSEAKANWRFQRFVSPVLGGALLVGVSLHVIGFLVFRVNSTEVPTQKKEEPLVRYISEGLYGNDRMLEEQAILLDSAPLFIPTRWNASQSLVFGSRDTIYSRFPDYEPVIDVENRLRPSGNILGDEFQVAAPMDLLRNEFWRFFVGFGQRWADAPGGVQSPAVAEVTILEDVFGKAGQQPASLFGLDMDEDLQLWVSRPAVVAIRKSSANLLQYPILDQSSGNSVFDQAIMRWISKAEVFGEFPDGYLSIRIFPSSLPAGGSDPSGEL